MLRQSFSRAASLSQRINPATTGFALRRPISSTRTALDDGTIRSRIKRRQRTNALQEAFKFGDDDEDEDTVRRAIIDSRKKGTAKPEIDDVPDLENLSKRWDKIDPLEQEEISLYLEQRMRGDWAELTKLEKDASLFIAFGPWGPRTPQAANPVYGYDLFIKIVAAVLVGVTGYQAWQGRLGYFSGAGEEPAASPEQKQE